MIVIMEIVRIPANNKTSQQQNNRMQQQQPTSQSQSRGDNCSETRNDKTIPRPVNVTSTVAVPEKPPTSVNSRLHQPMEC